MKKSARPYICTFIIALCTSCSVSKFIPEDKYLLDEVRIVSETKEVKPSLFNSYIRQNPVDPASPAGKSEAVYQKVQAHPFSSGSYYSAL